MTTEWLVRGHLIIRASDLAGNRDALAGAFANNGSNSTVADERKAFDNAARLSLTGAEPAQVLYIESALKPAMRDALKALLDLLPNARYAVTANTAFGQYEDGELILTNFPVTPNGQIVGRQEVLAFLNDEFGLQVIVQEANP